MFNDKKALSTVVASLLIILLVIVAIGVIWVVLRNTVSEGTGQLDLGAKCLQIDLEATKVECTNSSGWSTCNVTFKRGSGGDEIGGAKVIFFDSTGDTSKTVDVPGNMAQLETKTETEINSTIQTEISKVQISAYFLDESGNEQLCSTLTTLENINNS
jgi:hypothetical protein